MLTSPFFLFLPFQSFAYDLSCFCFAFVFATTFRYSNPVDVFDKALGIHVCLDDGSEVRILLTISYYDTMLNDCMSDWFTLCGLLIHDFLFVCVGMTVYVFWAMLLCPVLFVAGGEKHFVVEVRSAEGNAEDD